MSRKIWLSIVLGLAIALISAFAYIQTALACGGFFCQTTPVDQNAERIIFAQNNDGTLSTYIQIQYTGSAPDFSWILPLPSVISADDVEVPSGAMAAFQQLDTLTDPVFIQPETPTCVERLRNATRVRSREVVFASLESSVEVFATGEAGPYAFDVIGSEDHNALIEWLREHRYMVTEDMEPLINLYVDEDFVFLAMRLRPDQNVQDVQPVKITYESESPMIPLKLTAVAAEPDMDVMVWFYAETQATPVNFAKMEIANDELVFFGTGGTSNYTQLMGEKADEFGGHAFITEYAGPSSELRVTDPLLQGLASRYPYVTRLNTVISPEEMTVDPIFRYDPNLKDVSNVRDLSDMKGLYECEKYWIVSNLPIVGGRFTSYMQNRSASNSVEASSSNTNQSNQSSGSRGTTLGSALTMFALFVMLMFGLVYLGKKLGERSENSQ